MTKMGEITCDNHEDERDKETVRVSYLEAANGSVVCVALHHDLNVLHCLLPHRPGSGHLISYLLGSFLQLEIRPNCEEVKHIKQRFNEECQMHQVSSLCFTSGRLSVGRL